MILNVNFYTPTSEMLQLPPAHNHVYRTIILVIALHQLILMIIHLHFSTIFSHRSLSACMYIRYFHQPTNQSCYVLLLTISSNAYNILSGHIITTLL